MLIHVSALSLQATDLRSGHQIWIVGAPDMGATNAWHLTYFLRSQGENGQSNFGTNRVAHIVTAVHRHL